LALAASDDLERVKLVKTGFCQIFEVSLKSGANIIYIFYGTSKRVSN
jgi:hypothetical protein